MNLLIVIDLLDSKITKFVLIWHFFVHGIKISLFCHLSAIIDKS
jgi:hypothetical protein